MCEPHDLALACKTVGELCKSARYGAGVGDVESAGGRNARIQNAST